VVWSPNCKSVASASADKMGRVWDSQTGEEIATLKGHTYAVRSVSWSPDGKRLVTIAGGDNTYNSRGGVSLIQPYDMTVRIWDAQTGRQITTINEIWDAKVGWYVNWFVTGVAWSPDSQRLATASYERDQAVRVWDAGSGKRLQKLERPANVGRGVV